MPPPPKPDYNQTGSFCGWNGIHERWEVYTRGWGRDDDDVWCGERLKLEIGDNCQHMTTNRWSCTAPPPSANDDVRGAWQTWHFDAWENEPFKRCTEKALNKASLFYRDYPGEWIECCKDCHRLDNDWPPL
ncbi:hypothetical protein diail_3639 [Diaporthe ilicicola]|nr:hypothetical protein diail_3639 [Diaporthe ilicicola]